MKTIKKPGENLGGLLKIWAVPFGVLSVDGLTINFTNQSNIYQIYFSPDTADFKEASEETNSGNHYNTIISGFIPYDSDELRSALSYITPRKWLVIYIDGNLRYKLAGNQTDPLKFSYSLSTGKDIGSLAGFNFQFSGITKAAAIFINNPFG